MFYFLYRKTVARQCRAPPVACAFTYPSKAQGENTATYSLRYCALHTSTTSSSRSEHSTNQLLSLIQMARFEVKTSSILTLAECATELIPGWLSKYHEDEGRNVCTFGDTLEGINDCGGGRKRASSVNEDAGRPSKLAKYEAEPLVFRVPRLISQPPPTHAATATAGASIPTPRLICPPPKRSPCVTQTPSTVQDGVDISWISKTYRDFVPNDTLMHSRFMSECTYPIPSYHRSGGVKKRKEEQRKEFLDNDEWVAVTDVYSVVCKACEGTVALDNRNGYYYPGFWVKHRSVCPTVYAIWLQRKGMVPDADKEWFRRHKPLV
ncbi:hypothetical protein IW262DRAFT_539476 [Armillaria fumosa]|nr:hypothetical protein IW262DRAFT_539476 [Armillaria fumosa]